MLYRCSSPDDAVVAGGVKYFSRSQWNGFSARKQSEEFSYCNIVVVDDVPVDDVELSNLPLDDSLIRRFINLDDDRQIHGKQDVCPFPTCIGL